MHPATAMTAVQPPDAAQPVETSATITACQRLRPQPPISCRAGPPGVADGMKSLSEIGKGSISAVQTKMRRGMASAVAVQSG